MKPTSIGNGFYYEDIEFLNSRGQLFIHSWDSIQQKMSTAENGETIAYEGGIAYPNFKIELKSTHIYSCNRVVDVVVLGYKKLQIKGASIQVVVPEIN